MPGPNFKNGSVSFKPEDADQILNIFKSRTIKQFIKEWALTWPYVKKSLSIIVVLLKRFGSSK